MLAATWISSTFPAITQVTTVNAVGYVNLTFPPGYSLRSVPMFNVHNALSEMFPRVPNGTTVVKVAGDGFHVSNYQNGWTDPQLSFLPGEGFFIRNPASTNFTNTIVGEVVTGQLVNHLPAGHSICSSLVPQQGYLTSTLQFTPPAGTVIYQYDNPSQSYTSNLFDGTQWIPSEPSLAVGTAMRVRTPAAYDWFRYFSITAAIPPRGAKQALEVRPLFGEGQWWIEPVYEGLQKSAKRTPSYGYYGYETAQPQLSSQPGEVNFLTLNASTALGLVRDVGVTRPVTAAFLGQLYAGTSSVEASLAPVSPVTRFQAGRTVGASVKIPGTTGGQIAYFQLRAWEARYGPTYDMAVGNGGRHGKSVVFPMTVQAPVVGDQPGLPPPDVNQFPSFNVEAGSDLTLRFSEIWVEENHVHITFASEAGVQYRLEYKAAGGTSWNPLGTDITAAVSGITHVNHPLTSSPSARVYRISKLP